MGLEKIWSKAIAQHHFLLLVTKGQTLVTAKQAPAAVDYLKHMGETILGFEGFMLEGDTLIPLEECIADFTIGNTKDVQAEKIKEILASPDFKKAEWLEFTLK